MPSSIILSTTKSKILMYPFTSLSLTKTHVHTLNLSQSKKNDYGRWWGRPELNRRPLPGTVNPRPYGFLLAPEFRHPRVWSANPLLISGALNGWHRLPVRLSSSLSSAPSEDRAWLDYGPPSNNNLHVSNIYVS
jgi:hypothetical protein